MSLFCQLAHPLAQPNPSVIQRPESFSAHSDDRITGVAENSQCLVNSHRSEESWVLY